MRIGYFLSSEETAPRELVHQASLAEQETIREYEEAGFDELYVQQVGDGHERMFELYSQEILPRYNAS